MTARNVVDVALIEVGLSTGNVLLQEVMSFDISETDAGAEAVKTMRASKRAIGFKQGVPDFEVDIEVKPVVGAEVDWLGLRQSGEIFKIFYSENEGGAKFRLVDGLVTEVGKSFNADGEATQTVKILFLDHVPEET
jgi:hypothetical protein